MRRTRPRAAKVLLALSVVMAVAATLVLRGHLERLEARAAAAGPGTPFLIATADVARGEVLETGDLQLRRIPVRYAPPGALRSLEAAVGRRLLAGIDAGEVVTASRLAAAGGPVAALVPEGLRAVGVVVAVPPGPLAPGDRVDVLATYAGGQPYTETVIRAAEVLTVDARSGDVPGGTTLVLLVSPTDAERLAYARAFGDLSVAVVSPSDAA